MNRLLLHVYPTFAVGGAQMRFAAIANHFGRRWHHAIVALDGNTSCRERLDPGLDLSFPAIAHRKGDTLGNVRRYRAALREIRPHALMTANWGSIEWAMANAVWPVVRQVHVEDGFGPEERTTQLPRRVMTRRLVLRRCTTVLPSRKLLAIATETWRLPADRLRYIPNGIDAGRFAGTTQTRDIPVVGTVAALRAEKNIARLLRVFALATQDVPARLVVVGDGPERPALEALAAHLGIAGRVAFDGYRADPAPAYGGFDVFALSSDTEQMPLSVLEAMASGLPVLSTDVGDVASMLASDNLPFVAPQDDAMLASRLQNLLRDPAARARIGAANRAHVLAHYTQDAMFSRYAALFDGIPDPEG